MTKAASRDGVMRMSSEAKRRSPSSRPVPVAGRIVAPLMGCIVSTTELPVEVSVTVNGAVTEIFFPGCGLRPNRRTRMSRSMTTGSIGFSSLAGLCQNGDSVRLRQPTKSSVNEARKMPTMAAGPAPLMARATRPNVGRDPEGGNKRVTPYRGDSLPKSDLLKTARSTG